MTAEKRIRVAVIGHTGRGDYGHGLDTVWLDLPECQVVAVADADEPGRTEAARRLGNVTAYASYEQMLDKEQPFAVSIATRWLDQHLAMMTAAAARGIHIYLEKPFCRTLQEADDIVRLCEEKKVKIAIAYQTRYSPTLRVLRAIVEDGTIGDVLELRGRGKEDRRGGGEDLFVLGGHIFNLMHHFSGEPRWCFAETMQSGERVQSKHVTEGAEGIGPLAADWVDAMFGMHDGVTGFFASHRNTKAPEGTRFGLQILGTRGMISFGTGYLPEAYLLSDPQWSPGRSGAKWQKVSSQGIDRPEPLAGQTAHHGNVVACRDLLTAATEDRQPEASMYDARLVHEMIAAIFESHRLQGPTTFPLKTRVNPLTLL